MEIENTVATQAEPVEVKTEVVETAKTFTQSELDSIVEDRLSREKKKNLNPAEVKAFKQWQGDQQKQINTVDDNSELLKAQAELKLYKMQAKPEFMEFLISKGSEDLEEFKKNNPQYFGEPEIKKMATAPRMSGGVAKQDTNNDKMNSFLRGG